MTFQEVKVRNNRGRLIYSIGDEQVTFEDNTLVRVLFPDGHEEAAYVRAVVYSGSVMDMGHEDRYTTTRYEVEVHFHGIDLRVPITNVKVQR